MIKLRIDINAGKISETEGHNIMILTLSHELTHYAENFVHKEYADLQEFVFDVLSKNTGKDIKELIAEETEHQRRQNREHGTNIEVTESRAKSELVARGCELVLTDAETIRELAERNRGLFGKIKAKIIEFTDSIINACKEILGKDGNIKNDVISKEAMQMKEYAEKLRTLWNEAVGAAGESNAVKSEKNSVSGGVREMIRYDSDNNPFVEIDKDIFKGVTNKKERIKLVKEAIRDSFSTGIEIDEGNVWSSGKTRKEFTDSKYSNWLKRKHKIIYTRKLRMAGNADEIVKSVKKYSYETPLHPRKDNLIGFYRGDTKIRIGKFDYTADVILALDSSNKMYFYDIINIENTKIEEPTEPGSQMNENNKRLVNSSINSISRNSENDNNILKQDRNTDVIKKAANKLGVSERFLESNLEGRSRESAVQYLRYNNQVKNSFISEKELEVIPVLKEPTSSYGMSDNIKEFVRDNNISYKTLSENSRLREEYAKLIEYSKDGLGKKFLERRAQDKAQDYKKEIDEWYNNTTKEQRLKSLGRFLIERTSDVLKSINVKDYNIYFGKSKIQKILNKHQDMDIEFIKQVPEILEKPIIIMDSVTRSDSLVILGNLISKEGEPVIVSLLVDPKNKSGIIQDFGIITSAYGKNLNNLQKLINNSNIRYIEPDKKRTNKWLSVLRLQLPSSTTKYGSVNKITNAYQNVNDFAFMDKKGALVVANAKNNPDKTSVNAPLKDSFNESIFQNSEKGNDILKQDSNILYSYGGRNSNNVDLRELQRTNEMEKEGESFEDIFKKTGWFRGIDNIWKYEIDDSKMTFNRRGHLSLKDNQDYRRYEELSEQVDKILNKQWEGLNALYAIMIICQ